MALGQHGGLGLVLRRLSQSYPQLHERNDIRAIYSRRLVLNRRKPWTIRGGTGPGLAQMTQPLCRKGIPFRTQRGPKIGADYRRGKEDPHRKLGV